MTGESSHTTKYTKKQVLKIRDMFSKGATKREIREKLNIPKSTIYYITSVKTWKDI